MLPQLMVMVSSIQKVILTQFTLKMLLFLLDSLKGNISKGVESEPCSSPL